MKKEQDYNRDITEIRSMMERSAKFLSLSGWSGIMAGIYALAGVYIAYDFYPFNSDHMAPSTLNSISSSSNILKVIFIAILVLILAVGTAIFLSYKKAAKRGEKVWNATSRRLLTSMVVPLLAGGILILVFLSKGFVGFIAPLTLLFYGLAIYNASKFAFDEMKFLGLFQMGLGLISSYYVELSLLFWAIGFGVTHIAYGIYMHLRYERG